MSAKPKLPSVVVVVRGSKKPQSLQPGTTLEGTVFTRGSQLKFAGRIVKRGPTDVPKDLSNVPSVTKHKQAKQTLEFEVGDLDSALSRPGLQVRVVDQSLELRPKSLRLAVNAIQLNEGGRVELSLQRGPPDVPKVLGPKKPRRR